MPIYEFYCQKCHTIYNFLSKRIDTETRPKCPGCARVLQREVSLFSATKGDHGDAEGGDGMDDLPVDEARMEQAMESMAGDLEGMNEDDPRQAAQLMRKFSNLTGMQFNEGIEEAISRMEAGEDPEAIESELGDALDDDDPFVMDGAGAKGKQLLQRMMGPRRDPTLHDM